MPQKYPASFRARAGRMVFGRLELDDAPSRYGVIKEIAPKLSIATETLHRGVEQVEVDAAGKPGVTSSAAYEIRRLKREN